MPDIDKKVRIIYGVPVTLGSSIKEDPDSEVPSVDSSIVGPAWVELSRARQWALNKNAHQRFLAVAPLYWEYGEKSGIRPEVLYAQAARETGFGHYGGLVPAEYNNWAGIKTADASGNEPEDHQRFETPEEGVRAHFNHMAAYACIVKNTGNVTLTDLTLIDDTYSLSGAKVPASLDSGKSFEYILDNIKVKAGQHSNIATTTGRYEKQTFRDTDKAHYYGYQPYKPAAPKTAPTPPTGGDTLTALII